MFGRPDRPPARGPCALPLPKARGGVAGAGGMSAEDGRQEHAGRVFQGKPRLVMWALPGGRPGAGALLAGTLGRIPPCSGPRRPASRRARTTRSTASRWASTSGSASTSPSPGARAAPRCQPCASRTPGPASTPSSRGLSRRPAASPPGAWSWSTSAATSAPWW